MYVGLVVVSIFIQIILWFSWVGSSIILVLLYRLLVIRIPTPPPVLVCLALWYHV